MELDLHQLFSMKLKFVKLELHGKLEFHNLEFKKSSKSLIISQIVVDPYIFFQTRVLGHFGRKYVQKWKIKTRFWEVYKKNRVALLG